MRPFRCRQVGSWLGIFAMAMLFIGPMVGQWRAQLAQPALEQPLVAALGHHQHAEHGAVVGHGLSTPAAHAGHSQAASLVGALLIEHCGYCHLATHFCALPMALQYPLGLPSYAPHPAQAPVMAPASPTLYGAQARAPPQQLA